MQDAFWVRQQYLTEVALVETARQAAEATRAQRLAKAMTLNPESFTSELNRVQKAIMVAGLQSRAERKTPFRSLEEADLGILYCYIEAEKSAGRIFVLSDQQPSIHKSLDLLRMELRCGRQVIAGSTYRNVMYQVLKSAHSPIQQWAEDMRSYLKHIRRRAHVVAWRSALVWANALRDSGVNVFWHADVARDEETLAPMMRFASIPSTIKEEVIIHVADQMLATCGSQTAMVNSLIAAGVPEEHIVIMAMIAAPEGLCALRTRFPKTLITTLTMDGRLDERGYITEPGAGDVGDHSFPAHERPYDTYVQNNLVAQGIISPEHAVRLLTRMNGRGH